jgi:hypothetical protein
VDLGEELPHAVKPGGGFLEEHLIDLRAPASAVSTSMGFSAG